MELTVSGSTVFIIRNSIIPGQAHWLHPYFFWFKISSYVVKHVTRLFLKRLNFWKMKLFRKHVKHFQVWFFLKKLFNMSTDNFWTIDVYKFILLFIRIVLLMYNLLSLTINGFFRNFQYFWIFCAEKVYVLHVGIKGLRFQILEIEILMDLHILGSPNF